MKLQTTASPKLAVKFQLVGTPLESSGPAPVPPPVYPVQVKSVRVHPAGGPDSLIVSLPIAIETGPNESVPGAGGGVIVGFRVFAPVTGKVNVVVPVPCTVFTILSVGSRALVNTQRTVAPTPKLVMPAVIVPPAATVPVVRAPMTDEVMPATV